MTFEEAIRAIKKGDIVRLRHELDNGLSPDLSNGFGGSILMIAAMEGNTAIGRLLIERGAHLNTLDNFSHCALTMAVMMGHPGFVKLLLDSGASLQCLYPIGSWESFLDWAEKYCAVRSDPMNNIREIINSSSSPPTHS